MNLGIGTVILLSFRFRCFVSCLDRSPSHFDKGCCEGSESLYLGVRDSENCFRRDTERLYQSRVHRCLLVCGDAPDCLVVYWKEARAAGADDHAAVVASEMLAVVG